MQDIPSAQEFQLWQKPELSVQERVSEISLSGVDGTGDIGHFES